MSIGRHGGNLALCRDRLEYAMNFDTKFDNLCKNQIPQAVMLKESTSHPLSSLRSGIPAIIGIKDDHLFAKLYCGDKVIKYKSTKIEEISMSPFGFINVETRSGSTSTWMLVNEM